jgi:glycosyltransferase involved in cell wall biosynthesis
MRLLYVSLDTGIPMGSPKGSSVHVGEMLRALEAEGHATALLTGAPASFCENGRPVFSVGEIANDLHAAVRAAIVDFHPDVVYERYALLRDEACAESRSARLPHVLEVNAPLAEEFRRFRRSPLGTAELLAERAIWADADLVVTPTRVMAERVRLAGQHKVMVVPNAVDPDRFRPLADRDALRRELGLEDRFVVCWAGRLKPWHDLETLVAAVAALPDSLRAVLLLVGDGPERERVTGLARRLGVSMRLTGTVRHEDVPRQLAAADACVAGLPRDPRFHYFSPVKAMEYLAAGRPTVVAEAGDLTELVACGAALGYRPGEVSELRGRLEALAIDPALGKRLSREGRALAESRTWRAAARRVVGAVERILDPASAVAGTRSGSQPVRGGTR